MSFIKTGANTWAYEVSYQGSAANISPATNPIASGTMTFNADGTLANANSAATPATGNVSLTIPVCGVFGPQRAADLHQYGDRRQLGRHDAV